MAGPTHAPQAGPVAVAAPAAGPALPPAASATWRVEGGTSWAGEPLPGASVAVVRVADDRELASGRADAAGRFALDVAVAGRTVVVVTARRGQRVLHQALVVGGERRLQQAGGPAPAPALLDLVTTLTFRKLAPRLRETARTLLEAPAARGGELATMAQAVLQRLAADLDRVVTGEVEARLARLLEAPAAGEAASDELDVALAEVLPPTVVAALDASVTALGRLAAEVASEAPGQEGGSLEPTPAPTPASTPPPAAEGVSGGGGAGGGTEPVVAPEPTDADVRLGMAITPGQVVDTTATESIRVAAP
ncbi:MAG: hypothetical protein VKS61_16535 [Candidatus Sericytochromatia bacterium]|nr:hypothetical protein [Candidatus Sericytochromatia bacterium]